jgi:hypothetical protein
MAVMTFEEWLNYKALVFGGAPAWFEDATECENRYRSYREAFDGNCMAANPMDAALAPQVPEPHVIHHARTVVHTRETRVTQPVVARLWTVAVALLFQVAVLAAPAFAGEQDVVVNGETLSLQDRATVESVVGPLAPGAYWAHDNGDFGREGSDTPRANIPSIVRQRVMAAQHLWQMQQLLNAMRAQALQNAMAQREVHGGYIYGNNFSGGQRYGNGSWSHYNGYSNYGVGGTADGCIYTPNWSNC